MKSRASSLINFLALLAFVLAFATALPAADFSLVQDGQPRAELVIAEQPPRMVKLAAAELQGYVAKLSGAWGLGVTVALFAARSAEVTR